MGLPPILQITRPETNSCHVLLRLDPTLPCFQGHFPAAPVLAGVVQLDWVMVLARREFGLPLIFRGMQSVKFLNLVHPPINLTLILTHAPERRLLNFRYQDAKRPYSSGAMRVELPEVTGER